MTNERFNQIEKGNFILMNNGKLREVIRVDYFDTARKKTYPKVIITVKNIYKKKRNAYTEAFYSYRDLKHSVIGIFKHKKEVQSINIQNEKQEQ